MQALVGPNGLALDIRGPAKGAIHDLTMFNQSNLGPFLNAKFQQYATQHPLDSPLSILCDKGYIGIRATIGLAEVGIKKPPGGQLTPVQSQYNNVLSRNRIIVEHWFGRHKCLWALMYKKYTIKISNYPSSYYFCAALTNYHIQNHPLQANDPLDQIP